MGDACLNFLIGGKLSRPLFFFVWRFTQPEDTIWYTTAENTKLPAYLGTFEYVVVGRLSQPALRL